MTQKHTNLPQSARVAVVASTVAQPMKPVISDGLTIEPTPTIISTPILIETKTNTIASTVVYNSDNSGSTSIITNKPAAVSPVITASAQTNETAYNNLTWLFALAFSMLVLGIFVGGVIDRYRVPLISPFKQKKCCCMHQKHEEETH